MQGFADVRGNSHHRHERHLPERHFANSLERQRARHLLYLETRRPRHHFRACRWRVRETPPAFEEVLCRKVPEPSQARRHHGRCPQRAPASLLAGPLFRPRHEPHRIDFFRLRGKRRLRHLRLRLDSEDAVYNHHALGRIPRRRSDPAVHHRCNPRHGTRCNRRRAAPACSRPRLCGCIRRCHEHAVCPHPRRCGNLRVRPAPHIFHRVHRRLRMQRRPVHLRAEEDTAEVIKKSFKSTHLAKLHP